MSHLRQFVQVPWMRAESWASNQHLLCFPDRSQLANRVHEAFSQIPWTGYLSGFSDNDAPITTLATYLSSSWLSTTMINQQLDLLCLRARQQPLPAKFEIIDTHFFPKIVELYHTARSTYNPESPPIKNRHIWNIGRELANPGLVKQIVCGVFNIKDSHWVSIVVDAEHNEVLYGDSMGCFDKQVKDDTMVAVRWWVMLHLNCEVHGGRLPVTQQADSFSCGVCAINVIQHFVFPQEPLLLPHEAVTQRYRWFVNVIERHSDIVSCLSFYKSLNLTSFSVHHWRQMIIP